METWLLKNTKVQCVRIQNQQNSLYIKSKCQHNKALQQVTLHSHMLYIYILYVIVISKYCRTSPEQGVNLLLSFPILVVLKQYSVYASTVSCSQFIRYCVSHRWPQHIVCGCHKSAGGKCLVQSLVSVMTRRREFPAVDRKLPKSQSCANSVYCVWLSYTLTTAQTFFVELIHKHQYSWHSVLQYIVYQNPEWWVKIVAMS